MRVNVVSQQCVYTAFIKLQIGLLVMTSKAEVITSTVKQTFPRWEKWLDQTTEEHMKVQC
jgi:hypothetical protein